MCPLLYILHGSGLVNRFSLNGWSRVTIIILIFFTGLQCEQPAAPSNSPNFVCYVSSGFCTYSCQANKKYYKNIYGYVLCDPNTLQWGEIPDCVGKQLLLLLLLFVPLFTKSVTKSEHSEQHLTQSIISP